MRFTKRKHEIKTIWQMGMFDRVILKEYPDDKLSIEVVMHPADGLMAQLFAPWGLVRSISRWEQPVYFRRIKWHLWREL